MGTAIGRSLSIIAVVLMLTSNKARVNAATIAQTGIPAAR
jgi:hypothetical protein